MRKTKGQAAVGFIVGLAIVVITVAALAGALVEVAPSAWQQAAEERARARERVLGTSGELRPRWQRAGQEDGDAG